MNKFDFTTKKIDSVHMTVFEIVAPRNVDNWINYSHDICSRSVKTVRTNIIAKKLHVANILQLPIVFFKK